MFKGPIVYRLDCAGLDCAGLDSVGPDCAGPDRTCTERREERGAGGFRKKGGLMEKRAEDRKN